MKNKEFMMLQLFADGDNNDMTARRFTVICRGGIR